MLDFLKFFDEQRKRHRHEFELTHSNIVDWMITISHGSKVLVNAQSCDLELVFAKAQVRYKEWLSKNKGGY